MTVITERQQSLQQHLPQIYGSTFGGLVYLRYVCAYVPLAYRQMKANSSTLTTTEIQLSNHWLGEIMQEI